MSKKLWFATCLMAFFTIGCGGQSDEVVIPDEAPPAQDPLGAGVGEGTDAGEVAPEVPKL